MPPLLEACIETTSAAIAAEEGGALRVELCTDLAVEGLTPDVPLLRRVRARCSLPVFVLIRSRAGDFVYDASEVHAMRAQIRQAVEEGADGLVLGALDSAGGLDRGALEALLEACDGKPVTFHRAFDQVRDPFPALDELVALGFERVLTSGQAPTALEGAERLGDLVRHAGERLSVLVGGGVRAENAARLRRATGAREFHSSLGGAGEITAERVARLLAELGV